MNPQTKHLQIMPCSTHYLLCTILIMTPKNFQQHCNSGGCFKPMKCLSGLNSIIFFESNSPGISPNTNRLVIVCLQSLRRAQKLPEPEAVVVSSLTGQGLKTLLKEIDLRVSFSRLVKAEALPCDLQSFFHVKPLTFLKE